jgi:hypothetical protein
MKFNIVQVIGKLNTRLNIQTTTLKMIALGLAALVGVLILGGIQAIARVDSAPASDSLMVQRPAPKANAKSSASPRYATSFIPKQPIAAPALSPSPAATPTTPKTAAAKPSSTTAIADSSKEARDRLTPAERRDRDRRNTQPENRPAAPRPAATPAPAARPSAPRPETVRPETVRPETVRPETVRPSPRPVQPAAAPRPLTPVTPVFAEPNPALQDSMPAQMAAAADPTNYGDRYATDINGRPVNNALLVVLHETVGSASSAVNTMQTRHTNENDQVSYHSVVKRDGTVIYTVAPEKRAFGAGNSVFNGSNGPEAVKTHKDFPPSVNNFAYHISLESPSDGRGNSPTHSGYTNEQYKALAWLVAWTNVPYDRITTHKAVDQSGSRMDPRSFNVDKLATELQPYARTAQQ